MRRTIRIAFAALAIALIAASATAQTANSRISGTVADATGAVVPGARVTAKNEATGVTYTQTTTGAGLYAFPSLPAGGYTITVEIAGFKTSKQTGAILQVDTPLTVDISLEVGQTSEVVNVEGSYDKLQTANATIGNVVEQKAIEQLPLNGRNPLALITLEAGVTQRSAGAGSNTISVNGSRDRAFNVTIDGIDANESSVPTATNNIYRLNPDNIKEYKVTTNNATAEEGRNSGASVSVATRSGGNDLHGTVFHFLRNDALNTKEFFSNAQGTPKRGMKLNQFGFEVSGPIRKNKTFFFGSYQGNIINITQPIDQSFGVPIVYSPTALSGKFRYFIPDPARPLVIGGTTITRNSPLLVDPRTGALRPEVPVCSGAVTAGCVQTYDIFANDPRRIGLDKVTAGLLNSYPQPNTYAPIATNIDGLNTGGYVWNPPTEFRGPAILARVDHTFNETNAVYGRFLYSDYNTLKGDPLNSRPQVFPGDFPPLGEVFRRSHNLAVNYRRTISSRVINEFTMGYARFIFTFTQGETDPRFPAVPPFDFATISEPYNNTPRTFRAVTVPQFLDNLSIVSGAHVFRVGANLRFYRHVDQRGQPGGINVTPAISFLASTRSPQLAGPLPTNLNATDNTLFLNTINNLLGTPARLSQTFIGDLSANAFLPFQTDGKVNFQAVKHRLNQYNVYAQDEWRLRSNFTINYGVRWEINPPPNSGEGFTFVPDKSIIAPGLATPVVGQPGAVTFVKSDKWYEGKYLGVIGPRIGFAWSPEAKNGVLGRLFGGSKNRTVIRAGYGIAYDPLSSFQVTAVSGRVPGYIISCSSTLTNTAPFHTTTPGCTPAVGAGATQLPRLGDGFPIEVAPPTRKPSDFLNSPLQLYSNAPTLSMFDPQIGLPTVHQWNLSVQRELPWDLVGQVAYIGRRGTHLLRSYDINQINADPILGSFAIMRDNVRARCNADGTGCPAGVTGRPVPIVTSGAVAAAVVNAAAARTEILQNEAGAFAERIENNTLALRLRPNQQFNRITYLDSGGDSYYHGLQVVVRRRFGRGLGANLAYTLAKSIDNGSIDPVGAASGGGLTTTTSRAPVDTRDFSLERARSDFDRRQVFNVAAVWDLPFGKGEKFGGGWHPAINAVLGNWSVNGIFTAMSGEPFSVTSGARTSNNAHVSRAVILDPNLKAQLQEKPSVFGPVLFPDTSAFAAPEPGGNGGPRNVFTAPGFRNADFGLIKVFSLSERIRLQFRTEIFNAFNHANFDNPRDASSGSPSILSAVFAQTCCAAVSTPSSQTIIQTGESSRVIQFALKLSF
ncbi:MAG: carboxypeptidase regulatory-like domain-containing protein [Blastocatellia bacterium]